MIEIYLDIFECCSIYLHVHVIFSWGIRVTLKYLMEKENKSCCTKRTHKHTLFLSQLTWLNKRYKRLMFFSINLFIMCLSTCREVVVFYHDFISITLQIHCTWKHMYNSWWSCQYKWQVLVFFLFIRGNAAWNTTFGTHPRAGHNYTDSRENGL